MPRQARQLKLRLEGKNIKSIIEEECRKEQVNPIELKNNDSPENIDIDFLRRKEKT